MKTNRIKKKIYTKRQVLNILNRLRDKLWKIDESLEIDGEESFALNDFECDLIDEIVKLK